MALRSRFSLVRRRWRMASKLVRTILLSSLPRSQAARVGCIGTDLGSPVLETAEVARMIFWAGRMFPQRNSSNSSVLIPRTENGGFPESFLEERQHFRVRNFSQEPGVSRNPLAAGGAEMEGRGPTTRHCLRSPIGQPGRRRGGACHGENSPNKPPVRAFIKKGA